MRNGGDFLDSVRAKQIMQSKENIQVLYEDLPVWIESVKDNNIAVVTRPGSLEKMEIPVYMLVENSPVK